MTYYYIKSCLNGFVLDIQGANRDNGANVIMFPRNSTPSDNQLWQLEYQPDRTFLIISKFNGKALDCGGQQKGTKLVMWDRHGRESQRWRMDGNFITSMSGHVVDVESGSKEPGAHAILWTRSQPPSDNQRFELEQAPTGYGYGQPPEYQRPQYGSRTDPSYRYQPEFQSYPQPGYGFQPGYGSQQGYGSRPEPGREHQPEYGAEPGYGSQPGYGYQSGYGARPEPGYGFQRQQQPDQWPQPGYGHGPEPGYGFQPGYGSQQQQGGGPPPQYNLIQSQLSGLVLDIVGGRNDNGTNVVTYTKNNPPSDNQLWQIEKQPDGTVLIISKLNGKALDCGGQEQGTKLVMWDRHGRESQRWRIDGNYLVSMNGMVADVENNQTTPGTLILLWPRKKHHANNQLFDIVSV